VNARKISWLISSKLAFKDSEILIYKKTGYNLKHVKNAHKIESISYFKEQ
jgi:hypothetical protein